MVGAAARRGSGGLNPDRGRRRRGQCLTPRRGYGGEQPVDNVLGERIQLKPATIAPCSGEEWQRAIDLLAEIFVPLLADRSSDERRAA
jgi:hypothetical protein